jgi:hypothetical protein
MKDEAEWSRKLAFAFSQYRADTETRDKLLAAYLAAKTPSDLPAWFKEYIKSGILLNKE